MHELINVTFKDGAAIQVAKGTTLLELSEKYSNICKGQIVLALVDNELSELYKTLSYDCTLSFLDISDQNGFRAYQRSTAFLMIYAAKEILGIKTRIVVEHSINKNYYCEIPELETEITEQLLEQIEQKMLHMVNLDLPIEKFSFPIGESLKIAEEFGLNDKIDVLKYRRNSSVNFYKIDWFYDYFYGPMVPRTSYLKTFKLHKSGDGFVLQFASSDNINQLGELKMLDKISSIFSESNKWAKILQVDTVGSLNNVITNDGLGDIIRVSEALHEKKISQIADLICEQNKSLVLIAGPSSSGKTTFANRLCIQLRSSGKKPHVISLDDYYLNRDEAPLDEFGKPNFECLESIDVKQVNIDLEQMLSGKLVQIPSFNFVTGLREYKGRKLQLGTGDIIIMEGIHGLNEKLTSQIHKKDKFKVFISALTQLNMDDHNHIPTTDTRLIRRIVRDHRTRGFTATTTLAIWPSVLRGENDNIFPYQEEADAFFNSALVYEMCVVKQYVESILFKIKQTDVEYTEARRLIKFLDSLLGVPAEQVPTNSILREFIGGSCFHG